MATARKNGTNFTKMNDRQKGRLQGKKQLPAPIHVGHFVMIVVMKICKKILLADTSVKIGIYLIGVMVGSVVADMVQIPKSYLSDKNNLLNLFFVKLGWGWTFCALSSFVVMTSYIYSLGKWNMVKLHLLRLGMATFWWYSVTSLLNYIESQLGICSEPVFPSRIACNKAGKSWLGFDISGHVFLLIHNLLTISEEVKLFKDWGKLEAILDDDKTPDNKNLKKRDVDTSKDALKEWNIYIKLNIIFLAFLSVLWEFMLIISTVYRFHTLSQKVSAAFISIICWFISYRMLLQIKNFFIPTAGKSPLRFTKID